MIIKVIGTTTHEEIMLRNKGGGWYYICYDALEGVGVVGWSEWVNANLGVKAPWGLIRGGTYFFKMSLFGGGAYSRNYGMWCLLDSVVEREITLCHSTNLKISQEQILV